VTQTTGGANRVTNFLGISKTVGALGYTPLLVAVVRGQVDLALWLLDHGGDPNNLAAGFTPCIGPPASGRASPRIRYTASMTPWLGFRIARPSWGW